MEARIELRNSVCKVQRAAEMVPASIVHREAHASHVQTTYVVVVPTSVGVDRPGASRRRFLSATIALALTAAGAIGHGLWTSIAAVQKHPALATPQTQDYYRYVDAVYASGGVNAVQAAHAGATRSDAIKCIRWVRERKVNPAYGFLVSCMSDPRVEMRALAAYEALKIDPRELKVHLGAMQATLATETDVDQQTVLSGLIANVQGS